MSFISHNLKNETALYKDNYTISGIIHKKSENGGIIHKKSENEAFNYQKFQIYEIFLVQIKRFTLIFHSPHRAIP